VENSERVPPDQPATNVPRGRGRSERRGSDRDKPRRWATALALAAWFAVATLGAGEIVLRLASRSGILLFDTEMWRYAREVKRPSDDPGVVIEHRPNVEATLMGVRVRTDAHAFRRASPDIEAARTGTERVIAVVGDSCAFGWGVPEGATLGEQLEQTLDASPTPARRVMVVNASLGNSNTAMEYARFLRDVRPLHPAWVIVAFFINDAEPNPSASRPLIYEHSVLLAMLATRVPPLLLPVRRDYRSYYDSLYLPDTPGLAGFRKAVHDFGATLRGDGVAATMLLIPEMHEPKNFGPFAGIYRDVATLAVENGFEVIDPSGDFPAGSGRAYWVTSEDSHPNAAAHALFAAALSRSQFARQLASRPQ
jgi:lysophospholipase L1-like esterase